MVDTLAADLIYFTGSMPRPRFGVTPYGLIVGGIVAAAVLAAISPTTRAAVHMASWVPASPSPIPTPVTHAYIVLDTAAGGPRAKITVSGYSFPAGSTVSLYWDTDNQVVGSAPADSSGSFSTGVIPFPGSNPGAHQLCGAATGLNQTTPPCANFTLQGAPTPTPPASPVPSPSASPSASPSPTPSASPVVLTANSGHGGLDVITRPPFVFLPIIGLLALLGALAYWLLMRVERKQVLPSASVVHRSARPDVGAMSGRPAAASPAAPPAPPVLETPPEPPPGDAQAGSSEPTEPTAY
jgi:hypothetical protein